MATIVGRISDLSNLCEEIISLILMRCIAQLRGDYTRGEEIQRAQEDSKMGRDCAWGLVGLVLLVAVYIWFSLDVRANRTYAITPEKVEIPTDAASIAEGNVWLRLRPVMVVTGPISRPSNGG